jgi:DNA relaxase NicK
VSKNTLPQCGGFDKIAVLLPGLVNPATGEVLDGLEANATVQGPEVADALVVAAAPAPGVFRVSGADLLAAAPPSSNTGVQNTGVQLDWLSGTFPLSVTLEEALAFLGEGFAFNGVPYAPAWIPLERGGMGYKACVASGHMKVFHDGTDTMGVHFQFSGKGVRELLSSANIHTETDLRAWLARAVGQGIVFRRSDWACDDRSADEPLLDLEVVRQAIDDRSVVSKFKTAEERRKMELGKRGPRPMKEEVPVVANVINFGSMMSEMSVCFYDKAKERLAAGAPLPAGQRWVRCELRASDRKAHAMVRAFIEHGFSAVVGVLWSYLDFKQPTSDSNASRWPTVSWWERFLGECERKGLVIAKPERSVQRVREWFSRQVAPMLAVLWDSGHQGPFIRHMLDEGRARWRVSHRLLVAGEKGVLACPS